MRKTLSVQTVKKRNYIYMRKVSEIKGETKGVVVQPEQEQGQGNRLNPTWIDNLQLLPATRLLYRDGGIWPKPSGANSLEFDYCSLRLCMLNA